MSDEYDQNFDEYGYYNERRKRKAEQARIRRNRKSGLVCEETLFRLRSRYLLLFVTLGYKKRYRQDITLSTIQRHRDRFIRNMGSNPLLKEIQAYIWRLEEGDRSGLHLHFLIFYSGKYRADVNIAKMIGEYWEREITRGWGDYWNSNANKKKFESRWGVAVGQINRGDEAKRNSLRLFIENYMAKASQVPRDRGSDDRLFGVGIFD